MSDQAQGNGQRAEELLRNFQRQYLTLLAEHGQNDHPIFNLTDALYDASSSIVGDARHAD